MSEPLLTESGSKYTMFPVTYQDVWKMYKLQQDSFWRVEEVDVSKDLQDWDNLTDDERYFIKMILAFFASSDGIVLENLAVRFMNDIPHAEVRAFYGLQIAMENIHGEMYSVLIDTYVTDKLEKSKMFNAIENYPCIKGKADWCQKWITDASAPFESRLVAFACVEGIFFSGAFCSIYWMKKRGKMRGLTTSNDFISRDEGLHTDFAVLLYKKLERKLPEMRFRGILVQAVELEKKFITEAIPCSMIGMNVKMMSQYIEFVADRLSLQMGYGKIWKTKNPFDFMELISVESKANMFEVTITDYSLANMEKDDDIFEFKHDF